MKIFRRCIRSLWSQLRYFGWRVYIRKNHEYWKPVISPRNERWHHHAFLADPFLFSYAGRVWLFYETTDRNDKGVIGCFYEDNGRWMQYGKVLEQSYHLSYPQVFEDNGRIYMIPESFDKGRGAVRLFEARSFPNEWQEKKVLIDKPFVDATVFKYHGFWYMFCALTSGSSELWMAKSLSGEWVRHPQYMNINQKNSYRRCGGRIVDSEEGLMRVAQDCEGGYGLRLFKIPILKLTPNEYQEGEPREMFINEARPKGRMHTYNSVMVGKDFYEVVDVHWTTMKHPCEFLRDECAVFKKVINMLKN